MNDEILTRSKNFMLTGASPEVCGLWKDCNGAMERWLPDNQFSALIQWNSWIAVLIVSLSARSNRLWVFNQLSFSEHLLTMTQLLWSPKSNQPFTDLSAHCDVLLTGWLPMLRRQRFWNSFIHKFVWDISMSIKLKSVEILGIMKLLSQSQFSHLDKQDQDLYFH
jgi:hypothetical protein